MEANTTKILIGTFFLILLVCVGILVYWWVSRVSSTRIFVDRKEGIEMRYPKTWTSQRSADPLVLGLFVSPKENALDEVLENVNITRTDLAVPMPLSQYVQETISQMTILDKIMKVQRSEPENLGGKRGHRIVFFAATVPDMILDVHVIVSGMKAYNIMFTIAADQYEKYKPVIADIIRSVRFRF
ncbi:MAG: DUF1795 domain-containing protein [Elusimicrobia bacterium]|nr:DUF1795 domain-containing protein [Elusimicrobiota bacterium]